MGVRGRKCHINSSLQKLSAVKSAKGVRIGTLWCDIHSGVVRFCLTVSQEWFVSVRQSVKSGTFGCGS